MAASRIDSSRRLCARYRKFFIAGGVTLGLQLLLCHYVINLSQRNEEDQLSHVESITKESLNKRDSPIIDKRISANGGKGPPYQEPISLLDPRQDTFRVNGLRYKGEPKAPNTDIRNGPNLNEQIINQVPPFLSASTDEVVKPPKVPKNQPQDNNAQQTIRENILPSDIAARQRPRVAESPLPHAYIPRCNVSAKEISSAIRRAKSIKCKQGLADVYCLQQEGELYDIDLPNFCPNKGTDDGHYHGCYRDVASDRDLDGGMVEIPGLTPQKCIDHCFRAGQKYAGLQFGKECFCGNSFGKHGAKLVEAHCFTKCPGNASETCGAYLSNKIYATGVQTTIRQNASLDHPPINSTAQKVKIVFVLTVNGRAIRQVSRLLRVIYSPDHYYYIHVDKRQEFMYRELLPVAKRLPNVFLTIKRFATIWGGASLLQAHMSFLRELFEEKPQWKWDYYINLSESDYPIKPISQLEDYLTAYKGLNFLRSFGKNVPRFIKKQGMDHTFYECDNYLYLVSKRPLPRGIVFDGGSDWIGLHREFAHYAVYSNDKLVTGLKQFYTYSLLPVESFFHMVLQNSIYCTQSVDNNLHLTNWRRKQGCKCQYKHIVDWCGCSPNDLKISDMERLLHYEKKPMFFARKFEAVVDQEIINKVDLTFHGFLYKRLPGLSSFWQNTYHHLDKATKVKDAALTIYSSIQRRTLVQMAQNELNCDLKAYKMLEANIYNHGDHLHGLLVLFTAEDKSNNKMVTVEVHTEMKHYYTVTDPKGSTGRLRSLEVGTDFDVKELIFRNYGSLMGPYDDITLRHEWGPGPEFTVSIAWVDPTNEIAASYDVHIPSTYHVGNQKPALNKPLRPGIWTANIMIDLKKVAETQFLVTPLTYYNNKAISASEILKSHGGPMGLYTSTDFSEFMPNLKINDSPQLREEAKTNSKKTGVELEQWVDSLTGLFWVVRQMCVIDLTDSCPSLEKCHISPWSSRSLDLKSDMKYIGLKTPLIS